MEVTPGDLDDLEAALQRALDRIADYRAGTRVSADAFFPDPFMREHTRYDSFEAFREDAPVSLDVPIEGDSDRHRRRVNAFVDEATDFETWEQMQTRAAEEEILDQLLTNTA
ncbi:MAG: hypothetical protein ABEJ70_02670 [Halobacteriaceae archaeon]